MMSDGHCTRNQITISVHRVPIRIGVKDQREKEWERDERRGRMKGLWSGGEVTDDRRIVPFLERLSPKCVSVRDCYLLQQCGAIALAVEFMASSVLFP